MEYIKMLIMKEHKGRRRLKEDLLDSLVIDTKMQNLLKSLKALILSEIM